MTGLGQSETVQHVSSGGSFPRKQPSRPDRLGLRVAVAACGYDTNLPTTKRVMNVRPSMQINHRNLDRMRRDSDEHRVQIDWVLFFLIRRASSNVHN